MLSTKQRSELHISIYEYLNANGFKESSENFLVESNLPKESIPKKYSKKLESKWMAILRLQRKVMELEAEVKELRESPFGSNPFSKKGIGASGGSGKGSSSSNNILLPREPMKHSFKGHRSAVTCLLFHPVFNLAISGSEDATIKIWDTEACSDSPEKSLRGHTNTVNDLSFNSTGSLLASCSADMKIKIWSFETFECIKSLTGHDHNVSSVCFVPPDANTLLSASRDGTIKLWETESGYCTKTFSHDSWVRSISVSISGLYFISAAADHSLKYWSIESGKCLDTFSVHSHVVQTVAFAPTSLIPLPDGITINNDKNDDNNNNNNNNNNKDNKDDKDDKDNNNSKDVTPKIVASAGRDKVIKIIEISTGRCLLSLEGHDNWINKLVWHPSGEYLLSCSDDKTIKIWSLASAKCLRTIASAHSHFVSSIDLHPRLPLAISASIDQTIKLWECS